MAVRQIVLDTIKTYATEANAIKAVESKLSKVTQDLRYIIVCNANGRFYPVFLGEMAVQCGVHFHGFNIVG